MCRAHKELRGEQFLYSCFAEYSKTGYFFMLICLKRKSLIGIIFRNGRSGQRSGKYVCRGPFEYLLRNNCIVSLSFNSKKQLYQSV